MNPTATRVHRPPDPGGRLKGAIGLVVRVHYLLKVESDGTAMSACRGAVGKFAMVDGDAWITCPRCRQLEQDRTVPKMVKPTGL